jgi:basic membrane lipoprotein Med (substrate-binding protein (PBP1-ABC) superfamily)
LPVGLVAAGLFAAVLAVGAGGSEALPEPVRATGAIALVLPRAPVGRSSDLMLQVQNQARRTTTYHGLFDVGEVETVVLDDVAPGRAALERFADRLRSGAFGLVVWLGDGAAASALAPLVRALPTTTFVYVDGSLDEVGLTGVPNASAIRFAKEETSDLTGFLTGLSAPLSASPTARIDTVGIVAGPPTRDTLRAVRGFRRGLAQTGPSVDVLVGHVPAGEDPLPCETLANQQIDAGADVVVSLAGRCGLGALTVASTRNVWGIGDDEGERMGARQRERLLAFAYHDVEVAVTDAIDRFLYGTLPGGKTRVLGLEEDYSVGLWFNGAIHEAIASRVVDHCSELREQSQHDPTRAA